MNLPVKQETPETWVWSLGREDPLEKEMATHCSILAWEVPRTEEPGGLQSMGSKRVGHDWVTEQQQGQADSRAPGQARRGRREGKSARRLELSGRLGLQKQVLESQLQTLQPELPFPLSADTVTATVWSPVPIPSPSAQELSESKWSSTPNLSTFFPTHGHTLFNMCLRKASETETSLIQHCSS